MLLLFVQFLLYNGHIILHTSCRSKSHYSHYHYFCLNALLFYLIFNRFQLVPQRHKNLSVSISLFYLPDVRLSQLLFFDKCIFLRIIPIGHQLLQFYFIVIRPYTFHCMSSLQNQIKRTCYQR